MEEFRRTLLLWSILRHHQYFGMKIRGKTSIKIAGNLAKIRNGLIPEYER
jgi:hypothetical protein